jgi:hypothetical protein
MQVFVVLLSIIVLINGFVYFSRLSNYYQKNVLVKKTNKKHYGYFIYYLLIFIVLTCLGLNFTSQNAFAYYGLLASKIYNFCD